MMRKLFVMATLVSGITEVLAEESYPFQASVTPEIAVHPRPTEIRGLALNLWGENPQHGAAFGLANGSTGDSFGFTWSLYNYADSYTGVSWGLVNYSQDNFVGWQGGVFFFPCVVNIAQGKFTGFQQAVFNYAEDFCGLQLGLVNYSENLHGVQIGLVNIARNNTAWFREWPDKLAPGFIFVNWSF